MVDYHKYKKERNEITEKIITILVKLNTRETNKKIEKTIPMWFTKENKIDKTIEIYLQLSNFSKLVGILSYIPKKLRIIIRQIINNKSKEREKKTQKIISKILKQINKTILIEMHEI
jgi:hypothetical protein